MIYLYGYLGIGAVVLAVIYGLQYLNKAKASGDFADLLDVIDPDRNKLSYRILNDIVAPVLAAIFVVAVWPVAICMAIYLQIKDMREQEDDVFVTGDKFAVKSEHLLERLTLQEIEQREMVTDPLKAAPELPFGHLNAAWQSFLQGKADDAQLWTFSAPWQTIWGRKELRCGYVVVQNGVPGSYFLTMWKDIREEGDEDSFE